MEKMRKKKGDTGRAILFLAPALLLICCFTVIPIFEAVYTSFHKTQYAMVGEFVGLKNYISVMVESDGWKNIVNSIVYVVLSLLLAMPIGVGIGTLLNRKIRGMTIFRTMIIIPWTLSQTVTALLWKWLLNGNYGLITSWAYQLTGKKMDLFSTAIIAKILVVVVNVWNTVPVVIILTIAALQTISPELIEAAQVDGASRRMIYWKLTLPMIRPTMVTALVMQSIEYFNMVTLIYVLTAGGPFNATQTLSLAAYQNADNFASCPIPGEKEGESAPAYVAGQTLAIGKYAQDPEMAMDFIKFYLSEENQVQWVSANCMPVRTGVFDDESVKENEMYDSMQMWSEYAKTGEITFYPADYTELCIKLVKAVQNVVFQDADAKTELDEVAEWYNNK